MEHLKVQELIKEVRTASLEEKFYYIPVLLFFIRKLILALTSGESLKYTTTDIDPYVKFKFTAEDLDENNVLVIGLNGGEPIAVVTDSGSILHLDDVDIVGSGFNTCTIDLAPILTSSGLTVSTTWFILATNGLIE